MLNRSSFAWIGAAFALACAGEDPDPSWDSDHAAAEDPVETGTASQEWHTPTTRTWGGFTGWGATLQTRMTADGERIQVIVPAPAPTQAVPVGGTCGIQNADGVLLSCEPGTFCLSPASGVAGTCQPGLTAPRTDG